MGQRAQGAGHRAQGEGQRSKEYIVHVADPAVGLLKYNEEEFLKCWYSTKNDGIDEGTALLLEPTPDFYKQEDEEKGKLKFLYLLNYIGPYSKYIFQLMLGMLTASIFSLIFPFLTQSLVDTGIGNGNMAFVIMVLIAQLVLTLSQTANGLLRSWINLHIIRAFKPEQFCSFVHVPTDNPATCSIYVPTIPENKPTILYSVNLFY